MNLKRLAGLFGRAPTPEAEGYCASTVELLGGNRLTLLIDGRQAYPAMLEAVGAARHTVHLETYILRSDRTGWTFARALAERARAGTAVRMIYDSLGSLDLDEGYLQFLRNHGVQLLEYRPVAPWRRGWGWGRRDHRKILVVDGRVGFCGGINIGDDYAPAAEGGGDWRDTHVRIEGPAAYELDRLFRSVWLRETRRWFPSEGHPEAADGDSLVEVAANQELLRRHRIRRAYCHALRRARRSVCVTNSYFIPDRGIRRDLYAAAGRGAGVELLVPEHSDIPAVSYASRFLYDGHLRHGLRIHLWPGPVLHAKSIVIDGVWSAVGSYNVDHRSWLHNLEVNLHVLDSGFAGELEARFHKDVERSRELTLKDWRRRPLSEKALERLFYVIRYWL